VIGRFWSRRWAAAIVGSALPADCHSEGMFLMYKEFAIEAIVWLIPVVILIGLAYMITRPA
jgi:hypothetical protein